MPLVLLKYMLMTCHHVRMMHFDASVELPVVVHQHY